MARTWSDSSCASASKHRPWHNGVRLFPAIAIVSTLFTSGPLAAEEKVFLNGTPEELEMARSMCQPYLAEMAMRHGVESLDDLRESKLYVDEISMAHLRVQQHSDGVPVWGGQAIIHLDADGSLFAVTDAIVPKVDVDPVPILSTEEAIEQAVTAYGCRDCLTEEPLADLWVFRQGDRDHLVYRVQLRREDGTEHTALPVIFIDAHSGENVWSYDNLQTLSGTGFSLYSDMQTIETLEVKKKKTTYFMQDLLRGIGTFNLNGREGSLRTCGRNIVLRFTDLNNVWGESSLEEVHWAGVDAHYGAEKFYDYLLSKHGRKGIDGNGGPVFCVAEKGFPKKAKLASSMVHYGKDYPNAFWNGRFMTYGDGDGVSFGPLVSLDIAGHEMMHGVIDFSIPGGLTYARESGALNESWADVFGAMNELYARDPFAIPTAETWRIGEQVVLPGYGQYALRDMADPGALGQPSHYRNFRKYSANVVCNETNDFCGVHFNSGIPNKAFHLLAAGGQHSDGGSMNGIGVEPAATIWRKALDFMTSSTDFGVARLATQQAAEALYGAGSEQYKAVRQSWCLVGVECEASNQRYGGRSTADTDCMCTLPEIVPQWATVDTPEELPIFRWRFPGGNGFPARLDHEAITVKTYPVTVGFSVYNATNREVGIVLVNDQVVWTNADNTPLPPEIVASAVTTDKNLEYTGLMNPIPGPVEFFRFLPNFTGWVDENNWICGIPCVIIPTRRWTNAGLIQGVERKHEGYDSAASINVRVELVTGGHIVSSFKLDAEHTTTSPHLFNMFLAPFPATNPVSCDRCGGSPLMSSAVVIDIIGNGPSTESTDFDIDMTTAEYSVPTGQGNLADRHTIHFDESAFTYPVIPLSRTYTGAELEAVRSQGLITPRLHNWELNIDLELTGVIQPARITEVGQ